MYKKSDALKELELLLVELKYAEDLNKEWYIWDELVELSINERDKISDRLE